MLYLSLWGMITKKKVIKSPSFVFTPLTASFSYMKNNKLLSQGNVKLLFSRYAHCTFTVWECYSGKKTTSFKNRYMWNWTRYDLQEFQGKYEPRAWSQVRNDVVMSLSCKKVFCVCTFLCFTTLSTEIFKGMLHFHGSWSLRFSHDFRQVVWKYNIRKKRRYQPVL